MLEVMMQLAKLLWEPLKLAINSRDKTKTEREEFLTVAFSMNNHLFQLLNTGEGIFTTLEALNKIVIEVSSIPIETIQSAQFKPFEEKKEKAESEIISILTSFHNYYEELLVLLNVQKNNIKLFSELTNSPIHSFSKLFPTQAYRLRVLTNTKSSYIDDLMRRIGPSAVIIQETSIDFNSIYDQGDDHAMWRFAPQSKEIENDKAYTYVADKNVLDISTFINDEQYWKDDQVRVDRFLSNWPDIDFSSIREKLDSIASIVQEVDDFIKKNASIEQIMMFVNKERDTEARLRHRINDLNRY